MQSVQPKSTAMTGAKPLIRKRVVTQKREDEEVLKTVEPMKFSAFGMKTPPKGNSGHLDVCTDSLLADLWDDPAFFRRTIKIEN